MGGTNSKGQIVNFPILIRSAKNLKESDYFDKSDPYCICRIGIIGTKWDDKPKSTERCSPSVNNSVDPEWNFLFHYELNNDVSKKELHIKIMDNDTFTTDDYLGQVKISLQTLSNNYNEAMEYDVTDGSGKIVVMTGEKVNDAFKQKLEEIDREKTNVPMWLNSLQQYFSSMDDNIVYTATMVQFLLAGIKGDSGLRDWFSKKGGKDGVWNGPEDENCTTYMKHKEIIKRLKNLPEQFGTNNINGMVERQNNLGFQKLNDVIWQELRNPVIGLGQTQENHFFSRRFIDATIGEKGNWSKEQIVTFVDKFYSTRNKFSTSDFKTWTTIVLHKIHLNMGLTWDQAEEYMNMQRTLLISIAPGRSVIKNKVVDSILGVNKAIAQKKIWLSRYVRALKKMFPNETKNLSGERTVLLASNFMDSLLFAGGQSVPTVLSYAITLLYSEWLDKELPNFELSINNINQYVMEVIRYFPPVSGFVYRERSFGKDDSHTVYLSLHMGQCDKDVWGKEAHKFKLRSMIEYANNMIAWADPCVGKGKYRYNSRKCPGKDLSIVMITEFLKGFIKSTSPGRSGIDGGFILNKQRWIPDKKPSEININNYQITELQLTKNRTGYLLTDEQIKSMWYDEDGTKFDEIDGFTKTFLSIVQGTIEPTEQERASDVDRILSKRKFDNEYIANFGNLRLINDDEESGDTKSHKNLTNFVRSIGIKIIGTFSFEDKLKWFDNVEQGINTMRREIINHLPFQYNYWKDITSDRALSRICFKGVGQIYINGCNDTDREIYRNCYYKIDLSHLGKYETRTGFVKYGSVAYFNKDRKLLGIYSCNDENYHNKNDKSWEHVKFAFKSSLVTDMTLRYHLAHVHFIVSNSMMISARETLSKTHPLRKLLKPHYYRGSVINWAARETLIPKRQLAHRTWAFTDKSWDQLFSDVFNSWKYTSFPDMIENKSVDVNDFYLYSDGMLLWKTINKYIKQYLMVAGITDISIKMDDELILFWNHVNDQIDYGLPKINLNNLTKYLTDTIWWCTGGHEMAGSIVEYLVNPQGLMPKVVKDKDIADVQTFAQALIIISLTGIRQPPLMDDWSHLYEKKYHNTLKMFQNDLNGVSYEIRKRNTKRNIKYRVMDPKLLESSVSI